MENRSKSISMVVPVTDDRGELINTPNAREMRRLLVKDLLSDKDVLVEYVRTERYTQFHEAYDETSGESNWTEIESKGDQLGVVVSKVVNNVLHLGWSMTHPKDMTKYDRNFGIMKAMNRLRPVEDYLNNDKLPDNVRRTMASLLARNILYFKGK